jgi:hypothetical protein
MTRFFLVAIASCALLGCVKTVPRGTAAAPAPQQTAADFFALTVGASWTYDVELLGAKNTIEVKMLRQNADGFFEDSSGAALMADAYGVRDAKRYLLRNPVEVGTRWTNVVSVSSVEHYQVLATGQPCQTRFGSWDSCVLVESRNRVKEGVELVNELTLAPGVGIVRASTSLEANGRTTPQSRLELTRFVKP